MSFSTREGSIALSASPHPREARLIPAAVHRLDVHLPLLEGDQTARRVHRAALRYGREARPRMRMLRPALRTFCQNQSRPRADSIQQEAQALRVERYRTAQAT